MDVEVLDVVNVLPELKLAQSELKLEYPQSEVENDVFVEEDLNITDILPDYEVANLEVADETENYIGEYVVDEPIESLDDDYSIDTLDFSGYEGYEAVVTPDFSDYEQVQISDFSGYDSSHTPDFSGYGDVGTPDFSGYDSSHTPDFSGYGDVGTPDFSGYGDVGTPDFSGYGDVGTPDFSGYGDVGTPDFSGYGDVGTPDYCDNNQTMGCGGQGNTLEVQIDENTKVLLEVEVDASADEHGASAMATASATVYRRVL